VPPDTPWVWHRTEALRCKRGFYSSEPVGTPAISSRSRRSASSENTPPTEFSELRRLTSQNSASRVEMAVMRDRELVAGADRLDQLVMRALKRAKGVIKSS